MFVNGELIGGSSEALDLLEKGKLQQMIKDAKKDALPAELREVVTDTQSGLQVSQIIPTDLRNITMQAYANITGQDLCIPA